MNDPLLQKVDAVTIRVPSLAEGLAFYRDQLGHQVLWRNDAVGQLALSLPDSDTEIVLTTHQSSEPNWLVDSAVEAAEKFVRSGGRIVVEPIDIEVGRVAVVADPFGNELILVDLTKGLYQTDDNHKVIGIDTKD